MVQHTQPNGRPKISSLISGILDDFQELIKQHLALLKAEVKEDVRQAGRSAQAFAIGGVAVFLGAILLSFMLVHLLAWLLQPYLGESALWVCFGIVGAIVSAGGGYYLYRGQRRLDRVNPLPEKSLEALEEDAEWLMKQR